jgi:hypothetical protein
MMAPLSRAGLFSGCPEADFSGLFLSVFTFPVFIFSVFASVFLSGSS